jgi:hypothetical protein
MATPSRKTASDSQLRVHCCRKLFCECRWKLEKMAAVRSAPAAWRRKVAYDVVTVGT